MSSPENFEASDHRARLPNVNAAGISALTHAAMAAGEPLDFIMNVYAGSMFVTGLVAPPDWMSTVTSEGLQQDLWADVLRRLRKKPKDEQDAAYRDVWLPLKTTFEDVRTAEDLIATAGLELTLVDASVLPSIQTGTGKAGGHTVPVVRIPIASIDVWWIVDGATIKGSSGWSGSFGVLFPIDT